ncbi:hypothetical protein RFI_27706 [Reticulomyxa filosa]|uniref:Uncharacterized protein n=1 Tax=Reticulomyxa filosa TaxID=46433 RepID=X6M9H7_RETFI|nr:hypothetical protein RFI_27706 [Reticulomyxa filosa]|eukprot:ETO09670.1 hypothetical protein RFI_27706 [Reticulomyxa filosa]
MFAKRILFNKLGVLNVNSTYNGINNSPYTLMTLSQRNKTVMVGGTTKSQGQARCKGKRRSPKVINNQLVRRNSILVKQRWWIEKEKQWHPGFNVTRGEKGHLNAAETGHVMYQYDALKRRKYIHVVPLGEEKETYLRPFFEPEEIYEKAYRQLKKRIKNDPTVNEMARTKQLYETRKKQFELMHGSEHRPIELIIDTFGQEMIKLAEESQKLESLRPVFENQQLYYYIKDGRMRQRLPILKTIAEEKQKKQKEARSLENQLSSVALFIVKKNMHHKMLDVSQFIRKYVNQICISENETFCTSKKYLEIMLEKIG